MRAMGRHRHDGQGDDALARLLEERYTTSFRTACLILRNRADAEDAVEEAFLRAWRLRAALGSGANLTPWLYRVVVNSCCSKLRREVSHHPRGADDRTVEVHVPTVESPDAAVWHAGVSRDVLGALDDLPVHLRVPAVLRYYGGLGEHDVAIAIGRRPGTVKARLHEARRRLAAHAGIRALALDTNRPIEEAVR